jgi:hypothetical protein
MQNAKLELIQAKPSIGIPYVWERESLNPDRPHTIYNRWMRLAVSVSEPVYTKLTQFVHPQSNRLVLAQVVIAKGPQGRVLEGVFEGKAFLGNWYQVYNGTPHLIVSDSNFLPVLFRDGKRKTSVCSMDMTASELSTTMIELGVVTQEEITNLRSLGPAYANHMMKLVMD